MTVMGKEKKKSVQKRKNNNNNNLLIKKNTETTTVLNSVRLCNNVIKSCNYKKVHRTCITLSPPLHCITRHLTEDHKLTAQSYRLLYTCT